MTKSLAIAIAIVLLLGLQSLGIAGIANPITKWSQMPDMNNGHQFSSETKVPSLVADDWICLDGRPITDIHWWGGYWTPVADGQYTHYTDGRPTAPSPGTLQPFVISIWSNIPAGYVPAGGGPPSPYSRPGVILQTYAFSLADAHEVFYETTQSGRSVYQYYADLQVPFDQVQGTTYWLTINANLASNSVQWGWHESNDHNPSPSVQDFKGAGWVQIQNNQYDNDMAFELTTIPEPAGLSALCIGLASMGTFYFRRRR